MSNYRDEFLENSYYLVSNSGLNDNILFSTADDYKTFMLYVMEKLLEYPGITISAYCLLPNHFYFVVKNEKKGLDLSDFMRKIQVSYAMYFKKNQEMLNTNKGLPVFQGRFIAKLINIEDLEKIESCVSYDALNCELVEKIEDWPYTSAHQVMDTGYDYTQQTHIKIYNDGRKILKKMFSTEEHLV